eukprot:160654-Chlamydomonas_euryale.AAC.2
MQFHRAGALADSGRPMCALAFSGTPGCVLPGAAPCPDVCCRAVKCPGVCAGRQWHAQMCAGGQWHAHQQNNVHALGRPIKKSHGRSDVLLSSQHHLPSHRPSPTASHTQQSVDLIPQNQTEAMHGACRTAHGAQRMAHGT